MRTVFVADSPAQAHLVSGLLDESGIRNVVEGEMLFGVRADIGLTPASLPRVCVNDEDAARAVEVIRERTPPKPQTVRSDPSDERDDANRFPWSPAVTIAVLWIAGGVVIVSYGGLVLLPFVAIGLLVHAYVALGRRS
jgi:hypothetical protein